MDKRQNSALRSRSGDVMVESKLVGFLYDLMRDYIPPGIIEELIQKSEDICQSNQCLYSNGWLARYAVDIAKRLGDNPIIYFNDSNKPDN